jgi:TonB family protein
MSLRALVLLALVVPLAKSDAGQTDSWVEITTPHFVVVSNSAEKDARRIARQFEWMRSAFHQIFPEAQLDTAVSILVLAVEDKANVEAIEPPPYLGPGKLPVGGMFVRAPERNYILVWMNSLALRPYGAIYHEYTHFIQSRMGVWMPLWLAEGTAEYYQTTEIYSDEVRIGRADTYALEKLESNPLLPLTTLFAVDVHSPHYHEEDLGSTFYAESWALTHYLKTKDDRDHTDHVKEYLDLVHGGADPVTAGTKAFGNLEQLQSDLQKYLSTADAGFQRMPAPAQVDDTSFALRPLTKVQVDTLRGEFLARVGRFGEARTLLNAVLQDDPKNVPARVMLGHLAYRAQNYDEARKWCEDAVAVDDQDFTAHHCLAASLLKKGVPDTVTGTRIESNFRTAIRLNPSFVPAYDGLAVLLSMHSKSAAEAQRYMQKSTELDPGSVEVRIDESNMLMNMNRSKDAIGVLELALKLSHTPEEVAAVENVLQTIRSYETERSKLQARNIELSRKSASSAPVGITPARPTYEPQAEYTEKARVAKREGVCVLNLIVGTDGKPYNIVVAKRLGLGLDENAVEAVKKWRFEPARRNGTPILSRLSLNITFKVFGVLTDKYVQLSEKAKNGDPAAEFELANAFFTGRDIPRDESQGLALLQRAAQDGWPQAQFQMAERAYGDGHKDENYVSAYVWYELARRGGLSESEPKISELESRMTPEQLSDAKKRLERTASSSK